VQYNDFRPVVSISGIRPEDESGMDNMRGDLQKVIRLLFTAEHHLLPPKTRGLIESAGSGGFGGREEMAYSDAFHGRKCVFPIPDKGIFNPCPRGG
jgi:hypothetical protein